MINSYSILPSIGKFRFTESLNLFCEFYSILYSSKAETSYRSSVPSSHSRNVWARTNSKDKLHQRLVVSMKRPELSNKIPSSE